MAALWASRYGINCRVLDKQAKGIIKGQADGIQARTLEIFESFGFVERVMRECNMSVEMCFWSPDDFTHGGIKRKERVPECKPSSSNYGQVLLHQGRIENFFIDAIKENSGIEVERGVTPDRLHVDSSLVEDQGAYPITVIVQHSSEEDGGLVRETIKTKYLIGTDGAHSWTRAQLGFKMEGEQSDSVWGVIDLIPITDFPDIRQACSIQSASSGSILLIPRERKLVRIYVQLTDIKASDGQEMPRSAITPEIILKAAQKIFQPYTLTWGTIEWWAVYQIGQRVSSKFDLSNRVFLAGDAVHTHSPKAGQGMNVSIQDTYNLGWKVSSVLRGLSPPSILSTYNLERRTVAQELIAFDHRFSRLYCGQPTGPETDGIGVSMEEFKSEFERSLLFASGLSVDYGASALVVKDSASSSFTKTNTTKVTTLARNIKLGMRFPSQQVLNQADARPWQISRFLKSDGRWRIILFAGNILSQAQSLRIRTFCAALDSPTGLIHRYTPKPNPIDAVIEILTIHSSDRQEVELLRDFPEILRPEREGEGWDYEKVFVDDWSYHSGHGRAYEGWGVDKEKGAVVVFRPDGYVGWIGEVEDVHDLENFFGGVLIAQT
ncbi:hypothetical protein ACLMJK_003931 [Lecanora helva]